MGAVAAAGGDFGVVALSDPAESIRVTPLVRVTPPGPGARFAAASNRRHDSVWSPAGGDSDSGRCGSGLREVGTLTKCGSGLREVGAATSMLGIDTNVCLAPLPSLSAFPPPAVSVCGCCVRGPSGCAVSGDRLMCPLRGPARLCSLKLTSPPARKAAAAVVASLLRVQAVQRGRMPSCASSVSVGRAQILHSVVGRPPGSACSGAASPVWS